MFVQSVVLSLISNPSSNSFFRLHFDDIEEAVSQPVPADIMVKDFYFLCAKDFLALFTAMLFPRAVLAPFLCLYMLLLLLLIQWQFLFGVIELLLHLCILQM